MTTLKASEIFDVEPQTPPKLEELQKEFARKYMRSGIDILILEQMLKNIKKVYEAGRIPEIRISQLRQWINEKPKDRLVTNEDIELWLYGKENYGE